MNRISWVNMLVLLILSGNSFGQTGQQQAFGLSEKPGAVIPDDVLLLNEDSVAFPLKQWITRPTLISFVYYHCPSQCPHLLDGIAELVNFSSSAPGVDYQIVTISIDPSESPAEASESAEKYLTGVNKPVDPFFWRFLTADSANLRRLTDAVGYEFRTDGKNFAHTTSTMLITPEGKVSQYFYGTYFNYMHFDMSVDKASQEMVVPTRLKTLKYCYNYTPGENPVLRKWIATYGVVIVATVMILFLFLALKSRKAGNDRAKQEKGGG